MGKENNWPTFKKIIGQFLRCHVFENKICSRNELRCKEEKYYKITLAELSNQLLKAEAKFNRALEQDEQQAWKAIVIEK